MYCALIFNPSVDKKKDARSGEAAGSSLLRGAVAKSSSDSCDCGEASCQIANGVGICTYMYLE